MALMRPMVLRDNCAQPLALGDSNARRDYFYVPPPPTPQPPLLAELEVRITLAEEAIGHIGIARKTVKVTSHPAPRCPRRVAGVRSRVRSRYGL